MRWLASIRFILSAVFISASVTGSFAQKALDLRQPASKEWATIGGDWGATRYSKLNQINTKNIKKLKPAWAVHLGSGLGSKYSLEGTPIVKDGMLYIASGNDDTYAFDAKTGALIWEYRSNINQNITTVCCGWDNRGVAIGEGKVFVGQLDGFMVALDAKTGKVIWKSEVGKWQQGYTLTAAPLYHNGVIYTGIAGGDREARGKVTALDAKTGAIKWTWYTVPAPGEFGSETWPKGDDPNPKRANAWKTGGANVWSTPAIDPELGLIYFATGNPGPEAGGMGIDRPGDNLFSSSIVALTLDGKYKWHFQQVHHDLWDFDCPSPVILFDQVYEGKKRKGIVEGCKTGWLYFLDRETGKPLIGMEGWTTKCIFGVIYDQPLLMSPGGNGGINWAPMSFSPRTGYVYVTAADRPQSRILRGTGKTVGPALGTRNAGTLTAIDSRTNKIAWQKKMPYSIGQGSGALSTAGGLVFHGEPDGHFQAYDDKTGELLWQFQTGAGADAPAITYEIDGVQYVAIASGGVSIQTSSQNGDMLWVFSLKGSPTKKDIAEFPAPKPPQTVIELAGPIVKADKVSLVDYTFNPPRISVTVGEKVTFANMGKTPHNATGSQGGGWDTGLLDAGQSASVTFNEPGTYNYICTPHPFMVGQIIVTGQKLAGKPSVVVDAPNLEKAAATKMDMPAMGHGSH
ncbi:MAG: quinonprotein alcohol dehydrogenase [Methylocystaceae bacterium]|nr:quinonprotein alcohol dehydrogenase [Methylocystaceae bacterium]